MSSPPSKKSSINIPPMSSPPSEKMSSISLPNLLELLNLITSKSRVFGSSGLSCARAQLAARFNKDFFGHVVWATVLEKNFFCNRSKRLRNQGPKCLQDGTDLSQDDEANVSEDGTPSPFLIESDISTCHRVGGKTNGAGKPRQIIVRFVSRQSVHLVFRNKKNLALMEKYKNIFITDDLTQLRMELTLLNVCGLSFKLKYSNFDDFIRKYDIICLNETQLDEFDNINVQGYKFFRINRKQFVKKSGGVGVLVCNRLWSKICFFENSNENCVFGAIDITPEGSRYSSIEIFDQIESDIVDFRSEGILVCMIGDFNARSGLLSYFISVDQHLSDEFIDLCKTLDVHIANGRLLKYAFIDVHNRVYITVGAAPLPVVEDISNDINDDANNVKSTWNPDNLNDFINCIDQESVEQLSLFIDRIQVDGPCTSDLINDITIKTGKILTDAADKCNLFKKLNNLRSSKPKEYWCLLNTYSEERTEVLNKASMEAFYNHFIMMLILRICLIVSNFNDALNQLFSVAEINKVIKLLKNNKACSSKDDILNEYIKYSKDALLSIY
ncbi:hypothetical protein MAR_031677, partial [Mya arenaria]